MIIMEYLGLMNSSKLLTPVSVLLKQFLMARVFGSLTPMWATWTEFIALRLCPAQFWPLQSIWDVNQPKGACPLYVCMCMSAPEINT